MSSKDDSLLPAKRPFMFHLAPAMLNRPHLAVVDKIEQALGEISTPYGSDVGKHELGQNPGPLLGGSTISSIERFFLCA